MDIVEPYLVYFQDGLQRGDHFVIGVTVTVFIGLLTLVWLLLCRGSAKRPAVLLLGLCDAGKTLMFTRLAHKRYAASHTSIKENIGTYTVPGKAGVCQLVDLPGHERVRQAFLDQYKARTRAVIFVIDSLTLQKEIKDVADFLYTVLTDRTLTSHLPPILIACNKQDATLAKGVKVIQANLEKELNMLRVTKSAALQGTDNTSNNNTYIGKRGKDFQFADLKPLKVEFVECSARGKSEDSDGSLADVESWMQRVL